MKKTSKFSVQLAELRQDGLTLVKLSDVNNFVVYCRLKGVNPCGGGYSWDGLGQYFYIDGPSM